MTVAQKYASRSHSSCNVRNVMQWNSEPPMHPTVAPQQTLTGVAMDWRHREDPVKKGYMNKSQTTSLGYGGADGIAMTVSPQAPQLNCLDINHAKNAKKQMDCCHFSLSMEGAFPTSPSAVTAPRGKKEITHCSKVSASGAPLKGNPALLHSQEHRLNNINSRDLISVSLHNPHSIAVEMRSCHRRFEALRDSALFCEKRLQHLEKATGDEVGNKAQNLAEECKLYVHQPTL